MKRRKFLFNSSLALGTSILFSSSCSSKKPPGLTDEIFDNLMINSGKKGTLKLENLYFTIIDDWKTNAFASKYNNQYFIVFTRGLIANHLLLFDRIFADPNILSYIGNPEEEKNDLPIIENLNFDFEKWSQETPYFRSPNNSCRQMHSNHFFHLAMDFILSHEAAHIIHGHVDYWKSIRNLPLVEINYSQEKSKVNPMIRKVIERDADCYAISVLYRSEMDRVRGKYCLPSKYWSDTYSRPGMVLIMLGVSVASCFRLMSAASINVPNKVAIENYPRPRLRLRMILETISLIGFPDDISKYYHPDYDEDSLPYALSITKDIVEEAFTIITGKDNSNTLKETWSKIGDNQIIELNEFWNNDQMKKIRYC